MVIVRCNHHPGFQQFAFVDTETRELNERPLAHAEKAEEIYRSLANRREKVRVGIVASSQAR
jgi:hypothetical protein